MLTLFITIIFAVCMPGSVSTYTNEAKGEVVSPHNISGEAIEENNTRNLNEEDQWYVEVKNKLDLGEAFKKFASSVMAFFTGNKSSDEEDDDDGLTYSIDTVTEEWDNANERDGFKEFLNASDSVTKLGKKAFDKGMEKTIKTAEKRAKKIKASSDDSNQLVDSYFKKTSPNYILWDASESYWPNWEANYQGQTGSDGVPQYHMGTYDYGSDSTKYYVNEGIAWREYTGDDKSTIIATPTVEHDEEKESEVYQQLIVKTMVAQSCAQWTIVDDDSDATSDSNSDSEETSSSDESSTSDSYKMIQGQEGVMIDYGDSDVSEEESKTSEYQLTRLISELCAKGIKENELGTTDEADSIFKINVETNVSEENIALGTRNIYTREKDGIEKDEDGNYMYDEGGKPIYHYVYTLHHVETYITVTPKVTYYVTLNDNSTGRIAYFIKCRLSTDEEKEAFDKMVEDSFDAQYEQMCTLYGLTPIKDGMTYDGGVPGTPLTDAEIEEMLNQIETGSQEYNDTQTAIKAFLDEMDPDGHATPAAMTSWSSSKGIPVLKDRCQTWVQTFFAKALGQEYKSYSGAAQAWYYTGLGDTTTEIPSVCLVYTCSPYGSAGHTYGHVGIYYNGKVYDSVGGQVQRHESLASWLSIYKKGTWNPVEGGCTSLSNLHANTTYTGYLGWGFGGYSFG